MDIFTPDNRSRIMSLIKGKDTKPEIIVRRYLFSRGLRFRKNDNRLPGHPDIVFPRYKTVVFVNGCFWHGHEACKYYVIPKSNSEFWQAKIQTNISRDVAIYDKLAKQGWAVLVVWGCELKTATREQVLSGLYDRIIGKGNSLNK